MTYIYTAKMQRQVTNEKPTDAAEELCSTLCIDLNGKEIQKARGDVYMYS